MNQITLKAYAKLNLFLNIKNRREDGYHEIETVFERISLYDELTLKKNKENIIRIFCTDKRLEQENNLCVKAASLFFDTAGMKEGVDIHLTKNIPLGGGLGGASTDAASVLTGLNELFDAGLPQEELYMLGAKLGSDVNFFISSERFALGTGRGDEIAPIRSDKVFHHILLVGHEEIMTATIYKLYKAQLTKHSGSAKLFVQYLEDSDSKTLPVDLLYNALTGPYLELSKKAKLIFEALDESGEVFLLSGSGATINVMASDDRYELKEDLRHRLKEWGIHLLNVTSQ